MINQTIDRVLRCEHGRIVAAMLCFTTDLDLIEDALQDACLQALQQWPANQQPDNLTAWLITVTKRRLIDRLRSYEHQKKHPYGQCIIDVTESDYEIDTHKLNDLQLKLIFTCCHPAIARESRVALTLKLFGGLSASEIARAFLTSESTVLQRITRAKRKISCAGIPFVIPCDQQIAERLPGVLEVIYLMFNESHTASAGCRLIRDDMCKEALRLAKILYNATLAPEAGGLLAMILFHDARSLSRQSQQLEFIALSEQDRSLWNTAQIHQAHELLSYNLKQGTVGSYQLQAAIAGLHAQSPTWQQTDWQQIYALYQLLCKVQPGPVTSLNKCVALAFSGHISKAYEQLSELEMALKQYQPYFAAKAGLAQRLGKYNEAIDAYQQAIQLSNNLVERDYLMNKCQVARHFCSV